MKNCFNVETQINIKDCENINAAGRDLYKDNTYQRTPQWNREPEIQVFMNLFNFHSINFQTNKYFQTAVFYIFFLIPGKLYLQF